jgi:hypothetical protein
MITIIRRDNEVKNNYNDSFDLLNDLANKTFVCKNYCFETINYKKEDLVPEKNEFINDCNNNIDYIKKNYGGLNYSKNGTFHKRTYSYEGENIAVRRHKIRHDNYKKNKKPIRTVNENI